jgi:rSAM/selenodomain-associated transferase 1
MNPDCAVIAFVKFPHRGKVKTRLAKTTGEQFAAEFYKICAERIFSELLKLDAKEFTVFIYCSDKDDIELVSDWLENTFLVKPQINGNLGERMSVSFKDVFNEGYKKALIIGTDLPDLSADIINLAASKLSDYDFVVGPSSDGGYYLLGMRYFVPELFEEIEWSSPSVLESTIKKINALNKSFLLLDEKTDIDTENDLNNWMKSCNDTGNPVFRFLENLYRK